MSENVMEFKSAYDESPPTWGTLPEVQKRVNDFFADKDGSKVKELPCHICGQPLGEDSFKWAAPPSGVFFAHNRCIPEEVDG